MSEKNQIILGNFKRNIESVRQLSNFDHIVLEFAIEGLKTCIEKLKKLKGIDNPQLIPKNTLLSLQNIRKNDSLRPHYKDMFNQCIVLLVSYFAYWLEDLFRNNVHHFILHLRSKKVLSEEIRITISELQKTGYNLSDQIGEWIIGKKDISFQDMRSIRRAFSYYFNLDIEKTKDMNNIIFAQAARHIIAHKAGEIDQKFLDQVNNAIPRAVKPNLKAMQKIEFDTNEIEIISNSMNDFFNGLVSDIDKGYECQVYAGETEQSD